MPSLLDGRSPNAVEQTNNRQSALALHRLSLQFELPAADGPRSSAASRLEQLAKWIREHHLDRSGGNSKHVRYGVDFLQHDHGHDPNNGQRRDEDLVEYHYKVALQLRGGNFPLAALNLAAWQSNELNQLAEAEWNLIENCAKRMAPERAKNPNQHVRTQIECLISGCRLVLGDFDGARSEAERPVGQMGAKHASGEQTTTTTAAAELPTKAASAIEGQAADAPNHHRPSSSATSDRKCSKVSSWLRLAGQKAKQIGLQPDVHDGATWAAHPKGVSMSSSGLGQFGDFRKQLAAIHWLDSRCARDVHQAARSLHLAYRLALESSSPIEWDLYLDYANSVDGDNSERVEAIERAARRETQKRVGVASSERSIGELLVRSARRLAVNKRQLALELVKRAINLDAGTPDASRLALAGQLSFDLGLNAASEMHYGRALDELLRSASEKGLFCRHGHGANGERVIASESSFALRRQLGSAHANYGAILQVNKRASELVRTQYRRALECDPNNLVAAENLKRMR